MWNKWISWSSTPLPPIPYNINLQKGSKNVALTHQMVNFIINHPVVIELYNWLKMTYIPDEHFYATVITLQVTKSKPVQDVPNSDYKVLQIYDNIEQLGCVRFSIWYDSRCAGVTIRGVCNLGVGDLESATNSECYTANKFNLDVDPMAIVCQMKYLIKKEMKKSKKTVKN